MGSISFFNTFKINCPLFPQTLLRGSLWIQLSNKTPVHITYTDFIHCFYVDKWERTTGFPVLSLYQRNEFEEGTGKAPLTHFYKRCK